MSFHTVCEDGSTDEIGELLVALYRQCGAGDFSQVNAILEKESRRVSSVHASQGLDQGDAIDSDDENEGAGLDDVVDVPTLLPFGGSAAAAAAAEEEEEEDMGPDPDGWMPVKRGGRRKK